MSAKTLFNSEPFKRGKAVHKRHQISFLKAPTRTRQAPREGAQIDAILKRYATLGVSPAEVGLFFERAASMPYGVQPSTDYQTALNEVIRVEGYFAALPSWIREKFGHKPEMMVAFLADPANHDEAAKLGLIEKKPDAAPPAPAPEKKPNPS